MRGSLRLRSSAAWRSEMDGARADGPQRNRVGDTLTRHRVIGCSTWRKFGLRAPYPGLFSEPDFESTPPGSYLPRAWLGVPGAPSINPSISGCNRRVGSEFEEGFLHRLTLCIGTEVAGLWGGEVRASPESPPHAPWVEKIKRAFGLDVQSSGSRQPSAECCCSWRTDLEARTPGSLGPQC